MTNNKTITSGLYKASEFRVEFMFADSIDRLQDSVNNWLSAHPNTYVISIDVIVASQMGRYAIIKYLI